MKKIDNKKTQQNQLSQIYKKDKNKRNTKTKNTYSGCH